VAAQPSRWEQFKGGEMAILCKYGGDKESWIDWGMEELSIAITAPAKSDRKKSALGNV
jgi:hypothetical protein